MRYAQNQDKRELYINVTTVLPASGVVGLQTETFSGSVKVSIHPSWVPKRSEWQDRRIIPGQSVTDDDERQENGKMRVVVERTQYRMLVDTQKNRVFLEAWGDIVEPELFKHFAADWKKTCSLVSPGFTCLGDYTQVGAFFLKDVFAEGMKVIFQAGVHKVAVFWGKKILGRITTEQSAALASSEYSAKRKSFETRAEAEAWLES